MALRITSRLATLVARFQKVDSLSLTELYNVLREIIFVMDNSALIAGPGIVISASGEISVDPDTIPASSSSGGVSSPVTTDDSSLMFAFLTMGA